MSTEDRTAESSKILEAIRAKRERHTKATPGDIARLEASLIADIDSFDLNGAEAAARREQMSLGAGLMNIELDYPDIVPTGAARQIGHHGGLPEAAEVDGDHPGGDLLGALRHQAEVRQRELHSELAERTASNLVLDRMLKHLFFYLHDLVQQVNIVKPKIHREYNAAGEFVISDLVWHEGFADYRTQTQAAGAMVELVTVSCQLASPMSFEVVRAGPAAVDLFRNTIFDYGLQFDCKEHRNERGYLERAEFQVRGQIAVSARWKADFPNGVLVLETRNLERLGSTSTTIRPQAFDQALLDEFGRLLLALPNKFKELARR